MLELRTGEPRGYSTAIGALFLLVGLALIVNRVQLQYCLLVLVVGALIVACDILIRRKRGNFRVLTVAPDFSLTLIGSSGDEFPAEKAGGCWVSSRMIIIPLRTGSGPRLQLVISAARNDPDAFRRFTVICCFGFAVADSEGHNVPQLNREGSMK